MKLSLTASFLANDLGGKPSFKLSRTLALGVVFLCILGTTSAQTYYSRNGGGNWGTNGTWSTVALNGANCTCQPTAGRPVIIGNSDVVTWVSGTPATLTISSLTIQNSGTLTYGNGAAATTLTVTGDIVITGTGTLQSGATGANSHIINLGGNLTNSGTFNLTAAGASNQTVNFNGAVAQTISGTGVTTFSNLKMLTTASANVNVNSNITINNTLNFTNPGLLVVNSTSNITLTSTATAIAGAGATKYIQLDGTQGSNSQVIRNNAGTVAAWQYRFEIGTSSGGWTPLDMSTATVTTPPTAGSSLAVKAIYNASVSGHLRRSFRMVVTGNSNATTMTGANFYYIYPGTDQSGVDPLANYNTIWFLNINTGSWASVPGTAPGATGFFTGSSTGQMMSTGTYYYTIGSSTSYQTWYSYQTGNFSDTNVWTLDPSGTSLVNPFAVYPSDGDVINILNGFTVTADINNINVYATTVNAGGTLDMAATTGNSLGTVSGSGLLRINGVGLPTGTYTSFVSSSGGTIEYYNTGGTLPATQTTYNNLMLTNSASSPSAITFIETNDLTINNDFSITSSSTGTVTWQINDNSNFNRTINIAGDLTVSANGKITVGTGNSGATTQHSLTLSGNLTNNGIIQFFDPLDGTFTTSRIPAGTGLFYPATSVYTAGLRGNAVDVTFVGTSNKTVTCNNQTDFYGFIVNKGTGQQAILTVYSSVANNMRLFGPANLGSSSSNGADGSTSTSNNALSIVNGTLQLTGTLRIPLLTTPGTCVTPPLATSCASYFAIPQSGGLWLNGSGLNIYVADSLATNTDQRLLVQGLVRITAGVLKCGFSKGLNSGAAGALLMEGGTLNTWQIRPSTSGQNFSYIQTGGTVNIGITGIQGTGVATPGNSYARFSISSSTSSFSMSGGTLNIGNPSANTTTPTAGGIDILCSSSNYNVTGGTINAYIPTAVNDFGIRSTAPFYDLNIYSEGTAGGFIARLNQSLTVLHNLTLATGNSPTFNCVTSDLTIGGNFTINSATSFNPGTGTITFNGSAAQSFTNSGTISANLASVVVNKTGTLTIPNSLGATVTMASLTLTAGTLADGGNIHTVTTTLSNNATHTSTGSGAIRFNGTAIGGSGGTFGNLTLANTSATATTTSGNLTVTGDLRLYNATTPSTTGLLNIGSNNLTVLGNIYTDGASGVAFSTTKLIITSGNRNDQGLTRKPSASGNDLTFPVGSFIAGPTLVYTPMTMNITATTLGTVTAQPVASVHPNVTTTGQSVAYYWRVTSSGFAGTTVVVNKGYTYSTAVRSGTTNSYVAARFDASTYTWTYGPTATPYNSTLVPGTTTINTVFSGNNGWFNTNSGWSTNAVYIDGEYTAGNASAFNGAVSVYYSRSTAVGGTTNWNLASTWSNAGIDGVAAGSAPCSACPVVIGDATHNHTITIIINNQTCGSISIAQNSILDCASNTGLNFGVYSQRNDGTTPGKIRVSSNTFPTGDFRNFIGTSGGTVEYYGGGYIMPVLSLPTYYNLNINPTAALTITLPASSLTIYNNWGINTGGIAGTVATDATTAGGSNTLTVNNSLSIGGGTFNVMNNGTNTFVTNFVVNGSTSNAGTFQANGGNNSATPHTFTTQGSLTNNGTLRFLNGTAVANLTFSGSTSPNLTGTTAGATTALNKLTVNLGTSQTQVLLVNVLGTLTTPSTAWLTLTNGTINFNTAGTINIENANSFTIPATCNLKVSSGTVNVCSGNNDTYDLKLIGKLEVAGGTVIVGPIGATNNNDIEYASAGSPTIIVSGSGNLNVFGAIRRPLTTLAGGLIYNQSGTSTTTVYGTNCSIATNNVRGIFEIESNTGSSFTLGGTANLIIQNSTTGSSYPDLYLNPLSSSVSSTSTIQMGANMATAQTLTYNGVGSIGNFSVIGGGAGLQTVQLLSDAMIATGNLNICSNCALNTNSLNVTIAGNLVTNSTGVYNGSANTTTFNGSTQSAALSTGSSFQNITISSSNTVTFSGTAPSLTNLNILTGTLDVGNLITTVNGNIIINSTEVNNANGGGGYIVLGGTNAVHTITSSNGSFGNLRIGTGSATKNVTLSGNLSITGILNFAATNRYLSIGSNQLSFGSTATVTGTGSTAFIRTNGVTSDLGIVRTWPANANTSFTYELGTGNNYTPVTLNLNVNALGGGNITVIAVNRAHPTSIAGEQLLNYYWQVIRDNTISYTATGTQTYKFPNTLLSGSGGTIAAGYFDPNAATLGWITGSAGSSIALAATSTMTFSNNLTTNMPTAGKYFDYSVGTGTAGTGSLPNPIVPVYSRLNDANVSAPGIGGSWVDLTSWTTNPSGTGAPVSAPPTGVPVVILSGARINMTTSGNAGPVNARSAYTSTIIGTGILVLGTTYAHNLGIISGTGTLRSATSTLPAGNYNAFVSSAGGTIQYVAPMTMNSRSTYNNLSTTGVGTVTMTNTDLTLNGSLTIASGVTINNSFNNNISLAGNWTNNGGTFTAGSGTVTFTGTSPETIIGSTTFKNLTMAASANTTLSGSATTTVTGILTMSTGNIISSSTHKLALSATASVSGGSAASYVSGPMTAVVGAGSTFTFPLGNVTANYYRPATIASTSASDTWSTQYFAQDPTLGGFPHTSFNSANLQKVSQYEYWTVAPSLGTTSSVLSLSYNTGSYLGANIGVVSSLLLANWDNTNSRWDLPSGGGLTSQSGNNVTGAVITTNITSFNFPFTLGSTDPASPLPIELLSFTGEAKKYGVELEWKTASEINNDHFTVLHSASGMNFQSIGMVRGNGTTNLAHTYSLADFKPSLGNNYYRLSQTDFDGKSISSETIVINVLSLDPLVSVYPNPLSQNQLLNVVLNGLQPNSPTEIQIVDLHGTQVNRATLDTDSDGSLKTSIALTGLSSGLYILKVQNVHYKFAIE